MRVGKAPAKLEGTSWIGCARAGFWKSARVRRENEFSPLARHTLEFESQRGVRVRSEECSPVSRVLRKFPPSLGRVESAENFQKRDSMLRQKSLSNSMLRTVSQLLPGATLRAEDTFPLR